MGSIPQLIGEFKSKEEIVAALSHRGLSEAAIERIATQIMEMQHTKAKTSDRFLHIISNIILAPIIFPVGLVHIGIMYLRDRWQKRNKQ